MVNCSVREFYSCYNLFLAEMTESASYATNVPFLYRFPFRSCSAVQDEGHVRGRGADSNAGLSRNSTTTM